jgi:hypothetical protein
MGKPVVRFKLNATTQLVNRLIVLAREDQDGSQEQISFWRNLVELQSSLRFRDRLVMSPHGHQVPGVEFVGPRIVRIQFNGSFELSFGGGPIPLIPMGDYSQRKVSVGDGLVYG